jgi:hypothetical protein
VLKAARPPRPLARVMSTNVPLPVLRNSRFCPTQVTSTSGKPSLLKSPTATPIPYSSTSRPAAFVTSANVPLRLLRYSFNVERSRFAGAPATRAGSQPVPLTSRMSGQPSAS